MSGYWCAYKLRTSSGESFGSGSGSLTPLNSKIRESTWLSIKVRDLPSIELERVRALWVGTAQVSPQMAKMARPQQELGMQTKTLRQAQPPLQWFPCRGASELPSCAPRLCASLHLEPPWRQPPWWPWLRPEYWRFAGGFGRSRPDACQGRHRVPRASRYR